MAGTAPSGAAISGGGRCATLALRQGSAVGGVLRMRGGQGDDNIANLAAYMLCKMGGKESPSVQDVT